VPVFPDDICWFWRLLENWECIENLINWHIIINIGVSIEE
jgi:hypothetical protein